MGPSHDCNPHFPFFAIPPRTPDTRFLKIAMTLLKPAAQATPSSAACQCEPSPKLGWQHMPAFGSGYLSFASGSIAWNASPHRSAPALPHDNFWSSVVHPD